MFLENVVFDATDPRTLGRSWEARLGTEQLTDEPAGYETRLEVVGGPVLDLCFQRVPDEPSDRERLRLEVRPGEPAVLETIVLEAADPVRDSGFWAWLTGWVPGEGSGLRHPSGLGPVLDLRPEAEPKVQGKNPVHLDLRLEAGEDADSVEREILERGGTVLDADWGALPWRSYRDRSGNEFCVLPWRG